MPVAAIVGAVGGALIKSSAASKAANAQTQAADQAAAVQREQIAEERRQYDQNRADLGPYRDTGYAALGQLARGTQDGGEFNRRFTAADLINDPGYDFRMREGQRALDASASARGGILSGAALKAIQRYGQDMASQEFNNAYSRYQSDLSGRYNRISGLAGTGQEAVNTGITSGNQIINQIGQARDNIGNAGLAAGNARASQYVAQGDAWSGGLSTIGKILKL